MTGLRRPPLATYARNTYSQFGEDGIIQKIFEVVSASSKVCIEFGAWDGFHLSNTALLWSENAWRGILIEGDVDKHKTLVKNVAQFDCVPIQAWVGNDPEKDSLESILAANNLNVEVDLLSIDIDGNDYYVFESLRELRPKLIICEYNPTIPYFFDLVGPYGNYFGCSIASLQRVARTKGYELIAVTDTSGFFIREDLFPKFQAFETDLSKIAITRYYNHVITDYSGQQLVCGEFCYGVRPERLPYAPLTTKTLPMRSDLLVSSARATP